MYCNILYHNTLALQAVRTLATMAHFFKQMYSDNIFNLEEQFTPKELTAAITVEWIARKIKEIERKHTNTGELYVVGRTIVKKIAYRERTYLDPNRGSI